MLLSFKYFYKIKPIQTTVSLIVTFTFATSNRELDVSNRKLGVSNRNLNVSYS